MTGYTSFIVLTEPEKTVAIDLHTQKKLTLDELDTFCMIRIGKFYNKLRRQVCPEHNPDMIYSKKHVESALKSQEKRIFQFLLVKGDIISCGAGYCFKIDKWSWNKTQQDTYYKVDRMLKYRLNPAK